ncbi:hypothetical protein GRF59_00065 [Paenibacillus sp. HJL G12]|uniref:Uncharacterized protein n=1 Tax=Paenibacillus dendrobii TaxID=2691084 RepID=A0A7X3IDP9_9BACL|nr:hypothetical protein [Paenibacillus dendrobii]MWV42014.1 hypothetical protein [Paenibacillus dendrobii]
MQAFIKGCRSIMPLDEGFENLYGFSRLLRSLDNSKMDNVPDWLSGLREEFFRISDQLRQGFIALL